MVAYTYIHYLHIKYTIMTIMNSQLMASNAYNTIIATFYIATCTNRS